VLGLGLASALVLFVSIKTCTSRHGQEVAVGPRQMAPAAPEGKRVGADDPATAVTPQAPTTGLAPARDGGAPGPEVGNAAVIAAAGDAHAADEAGARAASAGLAGPDSSGKPDESGVDGAARGPSATGAGAEPARAEAGALVRADIPSAPVAAVSPGSPTPSPGPPPQVAAAEPSLAAAPPSPATESAPPAPVDPAAPSGEGGAGDTPSESPQGQKVMVLIKSVPSGARVTTAHHDYGTTPVSIRLRAGNAYAFFLKSDGYLQTKQRLEVTTEPEQEVTVTLKKGPGSAPEAVPAAASPSTPPASAPPPAAKPADGSWWQKMFKKR
jgi:hypothetical protein